MPDPLDDLRKAIQLQWTQYVSLAELINELSMAMRVEKAETEEFLHRLRLPELRPVRVDIGSDSTIYEDSTSFGLTQAIEHQLVGVPLWELSEDAEWLWFHGTFIWSKALLVPWCSDRHLKISKEWMQWQSMVYPRLVHHKLIDEHLAGRGSDAATITSSDPRTQRKTQKAARNRALAQAAKELRADNPGKSERWIANRLKQSKLAGSVDLTEETIRKVIRMQKTGR